MTRVALLWHMHQPFYEDLATREHILPWVRLHALKDYYGMVALLREFPRVKATFNLVPSLLVQLEDFAADRAHDRVLELSLKPAEALDERDVDFILEHFFHAQRQHMIDIYPRYAELSALRGGTLPTAADRRAAAARFSRDDLRDLQVWHKLAWIDPLYLDGESRARQLVAKGRGYTEDDKSVLRTIELEILNKVIPEYRSAAERGQIEISASPFYHPILPLLCDTDVYLRTHPDAQRPRQRFVHPEDAAEQLARAAAYHERQFGAKPVGLWPSEGSVSDAMVPLVAREGFQWMATDELILARTLGIVFSRDAEGHIEQPERLYRPYELTAADGGRVACVFRDHVLSDLIGFTYSGWNADDAANDFVGRLVAAGNRYRERSGGGAALIPIILDGENAWEHFPGGGRPFLRALYSRLSAQPELETVTMAEACGAPREPLSGIFPGSWIDANFSIWIGHADDQRAWAQLADARQALDASTADAAARAEAREEISIAEGSDWFWWYGDDHSSDQDAEFDDLFRRHLRNAYRRLGQPVPDELFVSNISTSRAPAVQTDPTSLIAPRLDGGETSYFEWLGAGTFEVREAAGGAMQRADPTPRTVALLHFGFDRERLFVLIDSGRDAIDLLAEGVEFSLKFLTPAGVRYSVRQVAGRLNGSFWDRQSSDPLWVERGPGLTQIGAGAILELALPFADLGVGPAAPLAFFVAVYQGDHEVERHPASRPIEVVVPDELYEARHWRA